MSIFDWFKKESETDTPVKHIRKAPATVDWTDSLQVNSVLTKGLYHNTYPGLKLGGSLAFAPIAIPVYLMGFPIPRVDDNEPVQDQLDLLVEQMTNQMKDIHIQDHREGTIWIFPKFSKNNVIWEFIPDESVSDIVRDLTTGKVLRLEVNEDIKLSIGEGKTAQVNRKRIFTRTKVTVTYSGEVPNGLINKNSRNPAGVLPIPFSNNADGNEIRGHSDYERIVSDLKSYHDIDLAEQTMLAKFSPKMIQNTKDVETWATNNGYVSSTDMFATLELGKLDLIMNTADESTTFEYPERMTASLQAKLKNIYRKIVEGSAIPEIAWGLKTAGNLASVDENMAMLMNYVKDKQDQKIEAYKMLFSASLLLLNKAMVIDSVPEIEIDWNRLDGLSDKTKSEIFKNFAEGISKSVGAATLTVNQLFKLWKINYPAATEEDFEAFQTGLAGMVAHTVSAKSTVDEILDSNGR
jgi:hypothetical protein